MKTLILLIAISIVLPVAAVQGQRDAWHNLTPPGLERRHGDITIRDRQGNLTIGDYDKRTGDLFLYDTKSGRITTGTRGMFGDYDIQEYEGLYHGGDDDD